VKIILGTTPEWSLQGFGSYAHLGKQQKSLYLLSVTFPEYEIYFARLLNSDFWVEQINPNYFQDCHLL